MNSGFISKIEKARRYAEEPDRVRFLSLEVSFRGDNELHRVNFNKGDWQCQCDFFTIHRTCGHVMTLQRLLRTMLPEEGLVSPAQGVLT